MIFADFYGPSEVYQRAKADIQNAVAAALRTTRENVVLRRVLVEQDAPHVELWVELSSEEQLYRLGKEIASRTAEAIRPYWDGPIWTMYRIVPLTHAFLDGKPRARGLSYE